MANFEIAYKETGLYEGDGYKCEEEDNGDWSGGKRGVGVLAGTIAGITASEVMRSLGKTVFTLTADDVKNFPESKRKEIYKKKYWDVIRGDEIESQELANKIYDEQVNAGYQSIKAIQQMAGLSVSGKMTDETIQYINNPL